MKTKFNGTWVYTITAVVNDSVYPLAYVLKMKNHYRIVFNNGRVISKFSTFEAAINY